MTETKKCPCCGHALEFSRSCHRVVPDKYLCTAALCWFTCNAEHYEKLCKAMKAKAELDALIEAARSVAAWHKGEGVIMRSELDALAALVGEG